MFIYLFIYISKDQDVTTESLTSMDVSLDSVRIDQ